MCNISVTKVQARWKTARDTYMKVKASKKKLKSGSGAKTGKKYIYYDMLQFLNSNACTEADESIDYQGEVQYLSRNENNISVPKPSTSTENSNAEYTNNNSKAQSSRKRKRESSPTPFEKELLECVKRDNIDRDDEDLNFFKSLIPTVKKLSSFKKLLFRTKILEALIDIEKETLITLDDLPSLNLGEITETLNMQNTTSTIDLSTLHIRTETQNTDTI